MSNYTTIPDAIVFPDGTIRLVTRTAKDVAYSSTDIRVIQHLSTANAVPDYLVFDSTIPQLFEDAGLVVKWERVPVGHYRSKRRRCQKNIKSNYAEDELDRHRARFVGMDVEQYRKQSRTMRAYSAFRARHHRMQQEAAEKRKDRDRQQE